MVKGALYGVAGIYFAKDEEGNKGPTGAETEFLATSAWDCEVQNGLIH